MNYKPVLAILLTLGILASISVLPLASTYSGGVDTDGIFIGGCGLGSAAKSFVKKQITKVIYNNAVPEPQPSSRLQFDARTLQIRNERARGYAWLAGRFDGDRRYWR